LSSSWYDDQVKLHPESVTKKFIDLKSNPNFINDLMPHLDTIEEVYFAGGEALITPQHYEILDYWLSKRLTHIKLRYTTNFSNFRYKDKSILDYWKKFKHVDIQFSIDNIGNRFELERGGSWQQVESNIKRLMAVNLPNIEIAIMPAVSIMNVFYLDELLQWAEELGVAVNILYVKGPAGFDLKNLTGDAKKLIAEKFQRHSWPEIKNILTYIASLPDSDGQEFLKLCKHFDALRNQNFAESHPEIAKAMRYVYNTDI
jgi:MoaA/NifB/PqqE/SkfB family radical SAM enzyme